MTIDLLLSKLKNVKKNGAGRFLSSCPSHEDKTPSMAITVKDDKILIFCHAGCGWKEICSAVGLEPSDFFFHEKTHTYGNNVYKKPRFRNPITKEKTIPSASGAAVKDKGMMIPLFCSPSTADVTNADVIYICEGETDAEAIGIIGGVAVCSHSPGLPPRSDISVLQGKKIVIVPDNDSVGVGHAIKTVDRLTKEGITPHPIQFIHLPKEYKDVRQFIDATGITDLKPVLALAISENRYREANASSASAVSASVSTGKKNGNKVTTVDEVGIDMLIKEVAFNNKPRKTVTILITGELIPIDALVGSEYKSLKYPINYTHESGEITQKPAWPLYIEHDNATRIAYRTTDTRQKSLSVFKDEMGKQVYNLWEGWGIIPIPIKSPHAVSGLPDGYHGLFMNLAGMPIDSDPPPILPPSAQVPNIEDAASEDVEEDAMSWLSVEYLLDWLAWVIQSPMNRLHYAAFIFSFKEGLGKGLLADVMASYFGESAVKLGDDDLFKDFSRLEENHLFAVVNEISTGGKYNGNPMSKLKILTTEDTIQINKKGIHPFKAKLNTAFYITSNQPDDLKIAEESRRFLVHNVPNSAIPLPVTIQMTVKANKNQFFRFLLDRKIKHLQFGVPPPVTIGKELAMQSVWIDPLKTFIEEWLFLDSTPLKFTAADVAFDYNKSITPESGTKHATPQTASIMLAKLGQRSKQLWAGNTTKRCYSKPATLDKNVPF